MAFKEYENCCKARCTYNDAPNHRGSVTLAGIYTSSLDQPGTRVFWIETAIDNHIGIVLDALNNFSEALSSKAPLYVHIDTPFRKWWKL